MVDAIMVDIDGTLAHMVDRGPYDPTKYHTDVIDPTIRELVGRYADHMVIVMSGRDVTYREATELWLHTNGVIFNELHMRPAGDKREDSTVKRELYEQHVKPKYNVVFVLDDRNRVVNMWRSIGLKCLQVAEGDF